MCLHILLFSKKNKNPTTCATVFYKLPLGNHVSEQLLEKQKIFFLLTKGNDAIKMYVN